ncbi:MAG: hypothetical protein HY907_07275 [Deltaproteobacteria bacterium]|nr:hypothetical protein [Deltaproteobacteria bacterium]
MTSFRSFLARERLVPVEQLDRALQRQILYGEDLSINLLEMGAVDEDELAQFLGMFHRLPIVTRSDLASAPREITARLPADLALRHRICPVAVADDAMVVASTRQLERSVIAELERVTGMTVSLAIASSLTLAFGLQVHYGAEVPPRYLRIVERAPHKGKSLPPPAPVPGEPELEEEEAQPRPRRASGIIVTPEDLPASELAAVNGDVPPEIPSTPEASMAPPPPPMTVSQVPPPLPPRAEFEASKVRTAADEVLRGVSLSHDSAADRLLEMVLGPPTQPPPAPRRSEPPRRPSAPPPAIDAAAALLGTAPAPIPAEAVATLVAGRPPAASAVAVDAAAAVAAPPARGPEPGEAVVRTQAVMLGSEEAADDAPERPSAPASPVDVLRDLSAGGPAVAPPPRTALINRIAKLDALGSPTDILRYAFQLFSATFKVGLLFDTTSAAPRLRDAFGVRTGAQGYRGRPLVPDALPSTVRNAAQPALAGVPPQGPLADLLLELFGELPYNALFLPITVGSRVVAVMYGDNREAATPFDNVRELFHLAWAAGTRLADLVRRRRHPDAGTPPDSGSIDDTERGVPPPPLDKV